MYLKYLSLKGFKSFADPVKIRFSPGLTVIVGPNGSGKSNLVDALTWVLGAQGPKALRSSKMEDVIFAGGKGRGALGRCEVVLTFDNSDEALPVPSAEVAIARSLFRSGDADYQLNGASCRLSDLTDLLSDAGVGKSQHVIISQGEVDEIVNSKSEERRAVLEEAAGIVKFQKRRDRAERRLAEAGEDLGRVAESERELRRQIRPLERQAKSAAERDAVKARHRAVSLWIAGREINELERRATANIESRAENTTALNVLRSTAEQLSLALHELPSASDSELLNAEVLTRRNGAILERVNALQRLADEKERSIRTRLSLLGAEEGVRRAEGERVAALARLDAVAAESEKVLLEEEGLAAAEVEASTEQLVDTSALEEALDDARAAFSNSAGELASANREVERLKVARARNVSRLEALERSRVTFAEEVRSTTVALHGVEERSTTVERELVEASASLDELRVRQLQLEEELLEVRASHSRLVAESAALTSLLESASGEEHDPLAGVEGYLGMLIDQIEVDPGYEFAVEAALGIYGYQRLLQGAGSLSTSFDRLVGGGASGSVRMLDRWSTEVGRGVDRSAGGVGDSLLDHVHVADDSLRVLVNALIGGFRVVSIDEGVARSREGSGDASVSIEGHIFTRIGIDMPMRGPKAMRLRLERLSMEAAVVEVQLAEARAALEASKRMIASLEAETRRGESLRRELGGQIATLSGRLVTATANLERVEEESEEVVLGVPSGQIEEVEAGIVLIQAMLEELGERRRSIEGALRDKRDANGALQLRRSDLERRRNELRVKVVELQGRATAAGEDLKRAEGSLDQASRRSVEEARISEVLSGRLTILGGLSGRLRTVADRADRASSVLSVREERARQADRDLLGRRRALVAEMEAVEGDLAIRSERMTSLEIEYAEVSTRLEANLQSHIRYLDATSGEIREALPVEGVPWTEATNEKTRLESRLAEIGEVNPYAQNELVELTERLSFLEEQSTDIRSSIRELERLKHQIEHEMRELFLSTFTDVSKSFGELFAKLFPGGSGQLVLEDATDPMATGIDLSIELPGKKVRRLSLLSGGERSLVGLAFLFAVFRARPAPFVVLDEVEAALDDRNLSAFIRLVDEFRRETQLIIVTHQKRTMETADVLVGVSGSKDGSSRMVREDLSGLLPLASA